MAYSNDVFVMFLMHLTNLVEIEINLITRGVGVDVACRCSIMAGSVFIPITVPYGAKKASYSFAIGSCVGFSIKSLTSKTNRNGVANEVSFSINHPVDYGVDDFNDLVVDFRTPHWGQKSILEMAVEPTNGNVADSQADGLVHAIHYLCSNVD